MSIYEDDHFHKSSYLSGDLVSGNLVSGSVASRLTSDVQGDIAIEVPSHRNPHGSPQTRKDYLQYLRLLYRHYQYHAGHQRQRSHVLAKSFGSRLHHDVLLSVRENGFAVIPNAFPHDVVNTLRAELCAAIDARQLCPVERNSQRKELPAYLTPRELAMGEQAIARLANIAYVKNPIVTCPSAAQLAFSSLIREIAASFYGCVPLITAVHVMKSFVNELPDKGFNLFHCDLQSTRFLKFFVYLNDVDEHGGPFTIVPKSRHKKPFGWRLTNKWSKDEIASLYGPEAINPVVANAGDLIVADTTSIHCGRKPSSTPRHGIMINTGVHAIKSFAGNNLGITRQKMASLRSEQQAMASLFTCV